ncbi:hypothetical protein K456DRAFT_30625 [Colletotrichum gloeosporioides 23]|nr:hypothetical protein K456DRAFT_30625 [Colletotrichum gloeosporioides 23]
MSDIATRLLDGRAAISIIGQQNLASRSLTVSLHKDNNACNQCLGSCAAGHGLDADRFLSGSAQETANSWNYGIMTKQIGNHQPNPGPELSMAKHEQQLSHWQSEPGSLSEPEDVTSRILAPRAAAAAAAPEGQCAASIAKGKPCVHTTPTYNAGHDTTNKVSRRDAICVLSPEEHTFGDRSFSVTPSLCSTSGNPRVGEPARAKRDQKRLELRVAVKLPSDRAGPHKITNSFGQEGSLLSNDVGDKEAIEQGSSVGESEREKLGGRAPRLFSLGSRQQLGGEASEKASSGNLRKRRRGVCRMIYRHPPMLETPLSLPSKCSSGAGEVESERKRDLAGLWAETEAPGKQQ